MGRETMKLSEAILKGAQMRPQSKEDYFAKVRGGQIGSCALGAAYEGATGEGGEGVPWKMVNEYVFITAGILTDTGFSSSVFTMSVVGHTTFDFSTSIFACICS